MATERRSRVSDRKLGPDGDTGLHLPNQHPYPQEGDWRAARKEDRQDRDQVHGHNRFWAEFWTRTFLLVALAGGGVFVAVRNEDAILRTGGMSVFSGVAGAVIQSFSGRYASTKGAGHDSWDNR